jgi:hypothetical protein
MALSALSAEDAPAADSRVVRRFGVFVGANNGGSERARLQWAVSDAQRMSQVMYELGGMVPEDSLMLTDPRQSDIQQALNGMRLQVAQAQGEARRVEFIFYYSGHSDEDGLLIGNERLSYKTLRQAVTEVKADVTIAVLDSCASGAFTRTKGGVRVQPFLVDASNDMRGYAFLTSASETEAAQESDRLGASFFTHYLVSALRGAAANGSGRVTLNEAYRYAFNETLARTEASTSGPQHPSYDINLSGTGDLVLSDLSQPSAAIILKEDIEGRVFVRDAKGYLVMEVNKGSGKPVTLALQPGSYTLRIETASGVFQAPAKLSMRQQYGIGMANFERAQLVATRSRGNAPAEAAAEAAARDSSVDVLDALAGNVLAQARARYARSLFNPDASAGSGGGAPAPAEPAPAPAEQEGIGVWETITQLLKPAQTATPPEAQVQTLQPARPDASQADAPDAEDRAPDAGRLRHVMFHFSLVPGVGTAGANAVESTFTFSPLIASVAGNTGLMASLFMNLNNGHESGVQLSTLFNRAVRLDGGQVAAIGNLAVEDSTGWQVAALFNIGGAGFRGFQLASLFNLDTGAASGWQGAALFNYGGPGGIGLQSAGLFNVSAADYSGVQIAGLFNRSGKFSGVQAAGLFNVDDEARGVLLAPINIVGKFEGLPLGVLNLIGNGIHDISYWYTVGDRSWVGLLNGSPNFYSIVYAGSDLFSQPEELKGLTLGLGVGGRIKFAKVLFVDIEASVKRPAFGDNANERLGSLFGQAPNEGNGGTLVNLVPSLRLDGGVDLKYFKAFVGLNADIFAPGLMSAENYLRDLTLHQEPAASVRGNLSASVLVGLSLSF